MQRHPFGSMIKSLICALGLALSFALLLQQTPSQQFDKPSHSRSLASGARKFWKTQHTWMDDFNGPQDAQPGQESCYSLSRPLYCMHGYNGHTLCPGYPSDPIFSNELKNINRCNWALEDTPSSKGEDGSPPRENRTFKNVEIRDGRLILKMRNHPQFDGNPDCGKNLNGSNYGGPFNQDCPFSTGGMWSLPRFDYGLNLPGAAQKFGRYEVRAKLGNQPAAFPALWMMPVEGKWPDAGEFDLLESFNGKYWKIDCTFHTGPEREIRGKIKHPVLEGEYYHSDFGTSNKEIFVNEWHVWGLEWSPYQVRFTVDDKTCLTFTENNEKNAWMPAEVPFYWILGSQFSFKDRDGKNADAHVDYSAYKDLQVDWVKNFAACEAPTDFCDPRDRYNGAAGIERCELPSLPQVKNVQFDFTKTRITYAPQSQTEEASPKSRMDSRREIPTGGNCPYGENGSGTLIQENGVQKCVFLTRDNEYNIYREDREVFSKPRCADYRNFNTEYLNQTSNEAEKHCQFVKLPYPNPYLMSVSSLKFTFQLTSPANASFEVYDLAGRLVYIHSDYQGQVLEPGEYEMAWDGNINGGNDPAASMYLFRMKCEDPNGGKTVYSKSAQKVVMIK